MKLAMLAIQVATTAASDLSTALGTGSKESYRAIRECEAQLDALDREVDERAAEAVAGTDSKQAREILACMKLVTDLERIGDLISSFSSRAEAVWMRLEAPDVADLIRMATVLETMLRSTIESIARRDLQLALKIIRADSEIDRLRNLIFFRHVEDRDGLARESVHVLLMAQALERAGDHAKNLGEEICHLLSGHTLRHVARTTDLDFEQMFLRWLREQGSVTGIAMRKI
ncbi:MAG: phosphate signaling complex PhoU family protein [Terriglobales bacterium]